MINKLKNLKSQLLQRVPTKLPSTPEELELLISDVLTSNDIPDNPLYHHAIASAIMHLDSLTTKKSKKYFADAVKKIIANDIAYRKIKAISEAEKLKIEEERKKADPGTESNESAAQGTEGVLVQ